MLATDCLIIGAGPAGLTAAIYLARFRRNIIVIDGGASRAELIPCSHNVPGFPYGISGADFLKRLREQAKTLDIKFVSTQVTKLQKIENLFHVDTGDGHISAKTIILATGVQDKSVPMDNWNECVSKGIVRLCPICDAYDAPGKNVALISTIESCVDHAQFLRTYFKNVSLYLHPTGELSDATNATLITTKIELFADGFESISVHNDRPSIFSSVAGNREYDLLYIMLGEARGTELARQLGARFTKDGWLYTDEHQSSNVKGLYAVGDVVSALHQVSVAIGQAAIAATSIHNSLEKNFI